MKLQAFIGIFTTGDRVECLDYPETWYMFKIIYVCLINYRSSLYNKNAVYEIIRIILLLKINNSLYLGNKDRGQATRNLRTVNTVKIWRFFCWSLWHQFIFWLVPSTSIRQAIRYPLRQHKAKWEFRCHAGKDMILVSYQQVPFEKVACWLYLDLLHKRFLEVWRSVRDRVDAEWAYVQSLFHQE